MAQMAQIQFVCVCSHQLFSLMCHSLHREKIMECVTQLSALLDLGQPFTWVVHDPSGLSSFRCVRMFVKGLGRVNAAVTADAVDEKK